MSKHELIPFMSGEFGQLRVTDIDGKPYFMARDAALALGYSNTSQAVIKNCKAQITISLRDGTPGNPMKTLIPEADLYRLVMRSKLPSAERFQDWVVEEVLPQIRTTGGYIPVTQEDEAGEGRAAPIPFRVRLS